MGDWLSSWAQGIVVAVIIGIIIEMILPEGNNKKYIKTIIGVYILFTIIVPFINKFTKEPFELDIEKYESYFKTTSEVVGIEEKTNKSIENAYKINMEEDIKEKLKEKDYDVTKVELDVEFKDLEKYGSIKKINLMVEKNVNNTKIKKVERIKIGDEKISENLKETISTEERTTLKKYLSEEYGVKEENIIIF